MKMDNWVWVICRPDEEKGIRDDHDQPVEEYIEYDHSAALIDQKLYIIHNLFLSVFVLEIVFTIHVDYLEIFSKSL